MRSDYPEIKNFTRILNYDGFNVKKDENSFDEEVMFADSAFFSMFTYPLLQGDIESILAAPFSLAISETQAVKYFGNDLETKEYHRWNIAAG